MRGTADQLLLGADGRLLAGHTYPQPLSWAESDTPSLSRLVAGVKRELVQSETVASSLVPPGRWQGGPSPTGMPGHRTEDSFGEAGTTCVC